MDSQKARAVCFCPCYRICYYPLNIVLNLCHLFCSKLIWDLICFTDWNCDWSDTALGTSLYRFFYNDSSYNMTKDRNIWHRLNVRFSVNLVKLIIEWSVFFISLSWVSIAVIQFCYKYCFLQTNGNQKDVARLLYLFKTPTYSPFSFFHDSRLCVYIKNYHLQVLTWPQIPQKH
jgi:hypothetical protein